MGICSKHDWSSLKGERCPGCVSDEALARGLIPDASQFERSPDEAAYGTELGVLRTLLQDKEKRIGELCDLVDRTVADATDASARLVAERDAVRSALHLAFEAAVGKKDSVTSEEARSAWLMAACADYRKSRLAVEAEYGRIWMPLSEAIDRLLKRVEKSESRARYVTQLAQELSRRLLEMPSE